MNIATQFINAITQEQLTQLIDGLFYQLPPEQLQALLAAVDPELEQIFTKLTILDELDDDIDATAIPKSIDKISEEWASLSCNINAIIFEIEDDEGDYISQEYHWEQPYFNESQAQEDLDKIFSKMLPLLKHCYQHELADKDYFRELIDEIKNAIDDYPEWFGIEYSDFAIGAAGSECLLYWNWLNRDSIEQFIESSITDFNTIPLTTSFTSSFFANEEQLVLKELYQILPQKLSDNTLNDVNSFWHPIYHLAQSATDRKSFLKVSADLMNQNWQYGITVYEDFMQNSEFKQAEIYCQRTIAEAFRQNSHGDFNANFTQTIFAIHCIEGAELKLNNIFADWKILSQQTGLDKNLPAINIQEQFYHNPNDCQTILQLFKQLKNSPLFSAYMSEWKLHITKNIISPYSSASANWIDCITDFAIDNNRANCMQQLYNYLEQVKLKTNCDASYKQLFYLTQHALDNSSLQNYPNLQKLLQQDQLNIFYDVRTEKPWVIFITQLLQQLEIKDIQQQLLQLWKKNICNLVPKLTITNGKYKEHAQWLAIAMELNPQRATEILQQWRNEHHLKRNLWSSLATYGITKKA
jgi:hypothetical protein